MSMRGRPCKNGPRAEWWRDYYARHRKRIQAYQKRHRAEKREGKA